jgi:UDP-N-acetylglucosamine 3-dehydrogenase
MPKSMRVAVIGAGQIAQRGHLPGFIRAGVELDAVCDSGGCDLEGIAEQYNAKNCYRDWEEMLEKGSFDAVSICTPPYLHCEMAVKAARRGCHVLVEKPMAITLDECDQMIDVARQAGVLLMVSLNQRFIAAHQIAKQVLDSGALGKLYMIHGVFGHSGPEVWSPTQQWYFNPQRAGRGVMADLGYHKIDLIRWLTGQDVTQIGAFTETFEKETTLEDSAVISFRLSQGMLGTLHVSWVYRPDWENSLVLRCERGSIRIPTEATDPVQVIKVGPNGQVVDMSQPEDLQDPSGWFGAVQAFVDAVQSGSPSPVPGEDGRAALATVLAAAKAAEDGRVISLG